MRKEYQKPEVEVISLISEEIAQGDISLASGDIIDGGTDVESAGGFFD